MVNIEALCPGQVSSTEQVHATNIYLMQLTGRNGQEFS